jgi:conjugative transfer ATPase
VSLLNLLGVHRLLPNDRAAVPADKGQPVPAADTKGAARNAPQRNRQSDQETVGQRRRMALRPPSFTDLLPYVAYRPTDRVFVLKDGQSMGVMFELGSIPSEAQTEAQMAEYCSKVAEVLQAIPESLASPWIAQFFVSDDRNIDHLGDAWLDYVKHQHRHDLKRQEEVVNSKITQSFLEMMRAHLKQVSQPNGLFHDQEVTDQQWRGQIRRVRCCIYKRFDAKVIDDPRPANEQLEALAVTLESTLGEAGVKVRRCTGKDLYEWLLPFFNRATKWAPDAGTLLRHAPYPGDTPDVGPDGAPILGADLAELLNFSEPYSDQEKGLFVFDGHPLRVLTLQNLHRQPSVGHFSAELESSGKFYARFDRMPPGSMLSFTVTIRPQFLVERHIESTRMASRAKTAAAMETHSECERVLQRMQVGDKLFPMFVALYLAAPDIQELDNAVAAVNALLVPTGMRFIESRQDLVPLDAFMRALPFNFDAAFDERNMRRSRLTFSTHIAALLPLYGRARGTGHPGMWFWNRGGEPVWVDPLDPRDRKKNAHMLVMGPTGAGKSASLNYLCLSTMAIHRPRMVIVDAGKSFALLMQYCKAMGLSTHFVNLSGSSKVSLPPFVYAYRLLDDPDVMTAYSAINCVVNGESAASAPAIDEDLTSLARDEDDDDEGEEKRDYLGEMLISAIMMITGGEKKEEDRMSRADRYLITRSIIKAAQRARAEARRHPLVQDVARELMALQGDESLSGARRNRAEDMGQSMMAFTQGLRGTLFNREGEDWPDADVTLVEMGTLTRDGYADALAVAYTSLIDAVQSRGEAKQMEGRPLVMLTDEAHLITTNDLLGPKVTKGTKMWRKLNMWFWLATQNLEDFPDSMSRVLSMCEFWMLLTMDKKEVAEVTRFRRLTAEQQQLMESARKAKHQYTEGVMISSSGQFLFRNIPPVLPLALAMTEGDEKAHRRRLMEKHGCDELQAAMLVANEISRNRGINV